MIRLQPLLPGLGALFLLAAPWYHGGGGGGACAACGSRVPVDIFEPTRAERDPGLAKTFRDEAAGVEWGLLQLDRYSSLYGAKDFWVTWRSLKGGAPPALGTLAPGAKNAPVPDFETHAIEDSDEEREEVVLKLLREGDGTWAPPVFTGVVYQFSPPMSDYLPTALLRFEVTGGTFDVALGVPEKLRASYPTLPLIERRFTLAEIAADGDADGLTNATEALYGTDPARADSDGDGVADGVDREPLTAAGAGPRTDDGVVVADALSKYSCSKPEPIIFEAPADGPIAIKNEGCVNLVLSKERVEVLATAASKGDTRSLDRSIEIIRHVVKREEDASLGTVMMVTVGDTMYLRHYLYKRAAAGGWELFKVTEPEIASPR